MTMQDTYIAQQPDQVEYMPPTMVDEGKDRMKKGLILGFMAYIASTALSFGVFLMVGKTSFSGLISPTDLQQEAVPTPDPMARLVVPPESPKDQECPLNGKMYTSIESASWEKRRPLAVMIENHTEARPQSGLASADVVFEAVVEGGITRFMPIFYCEVQAKDTLLAPVRSARQAFIDWASGFNMPFYAHVGGANGDDTDPKVRALEHLSDYGWTMRTDLNQFSIGYPTFVRNDSRLGPDKEIATEHTMESSTERLWAIGDKRGWSNMSPVTKVKGKEVAGTDWKDGFVKWSFKDDAAQGERGTVSSISHEFWTGYTDFALQWTYDSATNSYLRTMGGTSHVDLNTNKQISAKNVVVMVTQEKTSVDVHHHNYIKTDGTGEAFIFQNGNVIKGKWSKKDRTSQLVFTDERGRPVEFVRGQIWISAVMVGTEVAY